MSTSHNARLVYGFSVPRDHVAFGADEPYDFIDKVRNRKAYANQYDPRDHGDPSLTDEVLIGVAITTVDDFTRSANFARVGSLEPFPATKADINRLAGMFGAEVGLFVCGDSW